MQFVEFENCHQVDDFFDRFHSEKVAANVQQKPSVGKHGTIFKIAVVDRDLTVFSVNQSQQGLHCVKAGRFVACRNRCDALVYHDQILTVQTANVVIEYYVCFLDIFGESQIEAATRFYVVAKELNFAKKLVVAKHFGLCVHRKGTVDFYELLRCRNNLHNNLLILNLPKTMPKTNSDCHNVAIVSPAENILGQVFAQCKTVTTRMPPPPIRR